MWKFPGCAKIEMAARIVRIVETVPSIAWRRSETTSSLLAVDAEWSRNDKSSRHVEL